MRVFVKKIDDYYRKWRPSAEVGIAARTIVLVDPARVWVKSKILTSASGPFVGYFL
jgi:hypothetical protein